MNRPTPALLLIASLALGVATVPAAASPATPPCAFPSFAPGTPLPVPEGSRYVSLVDVADVNGDGAPDVALAVPEEATIFVFRNDGQGGFPAVESIPVGTSSFVATLTDVDSDGRADLVAFRSLPGDPPGTRSLVVWLSEGNRFRLPTVDGSVLAGASGRLLVADVNGDGRGDLVVLAASGTSSQSIFSWTWLENLGTGQFAAPRAIPAASGSGVLAAADVDGDGRVDLIASKASSSYASYELSVLSGDGMGGFIPGPPFASGPSVQRVVVADLDRNEEPDLVLTRSFHLVGSFETYLADGAGGFRRSFSSPAFGRLPFIAVGDVDRNGTPDLVATVTVPTASEEISVYAGNGQGDFPRRYSVEPRGGTVFLADFDRDGSLDILSVPGDYPNPASVLRNDCRPGEASRTLLVPVVASLPGANGFAYRTRLTLTNRSNAAAVAEIRFTPSEGVGGTGLVTLPAQEQTSVDAAGLLESLGISVPDPARLFGTLRLTASSLGTPDDFAAQAWVSVTRPGQTDPSSGVSFPAISEAEAFDGTAFLGGLREDGRDRTNLGLVHAGAPDDPDVVLRVTLYPGDLTAESPVVLPDVRLGAGRVTQLDRVLRFAGLSSTHAFARVERVAGTSRFYAFAVVNDEGTSDGSFLPAVSAGAGRGQRRLVVPSVVEAGIYSTDLFVTNASTAAKRVRLEWVADGLAGGSAVLAVDLPPSTQILLDDLVERFRASGGPGIPPPGANLAGALFASVEEGDVEGLLLGSRVTTPATGSGGRYGVSLPAVQVEGLASRPVFLPVSQPGCSSRTNLALVNAGEVGSGLASFHVEVWDGTARTLLFEKRIYQVPERGFLQLSPLVPPCASASGELVVKVTREFGSAPFLAYAVVNDGAGPGEGTGDGAVIGMRTEPSP